MAELYVGLISGTSVDGVDAVVADFSDDRCRIVAARTTAYPPEVAARVRSLITDPVIPLAQLGALDIAVGRFFAACARAIMSEAGCAPADVVAIGHHGQTVFHEPSGPEPFTLQIGDPSAIVAATGVTTVADFRRLDMALGGQGAPMVPAFHEWAFGSADEVRIVLNVGGIANVTILAPGAPTTGFDTGPGNALLDAWIGRCRGRGFDERGAWAASGSVDPSLLEACLGEPYFDLPPPKSTGRELFHLRWLEARLAERGAPLEHGDVQATLAELTAQSIAAAITRLGTPTYRLIVCGGGAYNLDLLARLEAATGVAPETTQAFGIAPDWIEAAAFAWLARARLRGLAGNVPTVTGARQPAVLGGLYYGGGSEIQPKQ
jgi:anhydro-N-acetylmuramic acid kinase